jgi:type II secretory pathway predicted ATPase ExeA
MYLEFFGLREYPFRLTPDVDFLFMSNAHARAKAYMDYSVWNREGFVVITGEIGCGKTTLIQTLLSELNDENILVANIFQTQIDDVEFLQAVLVEFGLNPFSAKKVELMDMLNTFLIENFHKDKQAILIVDEAHNLSMKAFEEVRMLSSLETHKQKILHVILVGQPQLSEILDSPEMEQLTQRVRLRFHLKPLSEPDTAEYITHRLHVAGAQRKNIFEAGTASMIYEYTGGVPRLINTLCDTALTCAYADTIQTVTKGVISTAADELQWLPYAKRINAKRLKERAMQVVKMGALTDEQERGLANIGNRLNQMDTLAPEIGSISVKIGNIESLLKQILKALQKDESGQATQKKNQQLR